MTVISMTKRCSCKAVHLHHLQQQNFKERSSEFFYNLSARLFYLKNTKHILSNRKAVKIGITKQEQLPYHVLCLLWMATIIDTINNKSDFMVFY